MNKKLRVIGLVGGSRLLTLSVVAESSLIVAPHSTGRDADMAGVVVASPDDGSSTLLINPAGVVSEARKEAMVAIMPITFKMRYVNPMTGYEESGRKDAMALSMWRGLGESDNGWSRGVGVYGSLGTAYDLAADPSIGQTSPYLGETGVLNFGFNIGRQLTPEWRIGFQVAPRYGVQEIKSPSPFGDISFKNQGVGIGGSVGLVYTPKDFLSFGMVYRTPGIVRFKGDGRVGGVKQDLTVKMITPQNITLGVAYDYSERLRLLSQVVWTRYEDFERGEKKFELTKQLNGPLLSNTRNRVRVGLALEYEVKPGHYFRAGYTRGKAMIEDEALSPTLFDVDNDMLMTGYEIDNGGWRLGFTAGYTKNKPRTISVDENPYFPGTYKDQTPISFAIRATWDVD